MLNRVSPHAMLSGGTLFSPPIRQILPAAASRSLQEHYAPLAFNGIDVGQSAIFSAWVATGMLIARTKRGCKLQPWHGELGVSRQKRA
jgi:hypothetical protein